MLSYRIDTAPTVPAHQVSADLRSLLAVVPQLTITQVQLRPPFRDPPVAVTVLSVPDAARPALGRRLVPRWFGEAAAPLRLVGAVAVRPEWSWSALLVAHPSAVPLGVIIAAHWPSTRLDLHVTASGCAVRLWACGPPSQEARAAIRKAGWKLVPLQRLPHPLHPLLLQGALLVGRAPQLTLELGAATAPPVVTAEGETEAEGEGETEAIFPAKLPPAETPAARLLAEAWQAAQQPPSTEEEDTPPPASPGDEGGEEEALSPWPAGPGRLSPRQLEAVLERVLSDPDVAERGLTKNKLRAAGAGPDAEALLAWLDGAGLLVNPSKPDDPVVRWREPRLLALTDAALIAERLRAAALPDEATIAQVRAAFAPLVPPGGTP